MKINALCLLAIGLTSLSACGIFSSEDEKPPLPGERVSVLQLQRNLEDNDVTLKATGFIAPEQWANEFWPQVGGDPSHAMGQLALSPNALTKLWQVSIGSGSKTGFPITAQPVVSNGRIFTLDTSSKITAYDVNTGKQLWRNNVRPKGEDELVLGGGIVATPQMIYVTNGYNELLALNPQSGGIVYRIKLPSPSRAAPTVHNGRVFIVTLDNRLLALNAQDGSTLWDYQALSEDTSLVGAASPTVTDNVVVAAFSSGELTALNPQSGAVMWSEDLAPSVRVGGLVSLPDIQALPVIDKGKVFGISFGGRMMAFDEMTGAPQWQRDLNGADTPWVAGNFIFLITSMNELTAISRDTGALAWVKPLGSYFKLPEGRSNTLWNGPILAGGRLIITAPEGSVLEIDPNTGDLLRRFGAGAVVSVPPIVAGQTLFLLTADGQLKAYR
jgi:outer membrane protein assembly factor BamB